MLGEALMVAVCLYLFLRGWRRDIRMPLAFQADSLLPLMQSKSTIDNGWWWFNPMLGAPFGLDELAFPVNSNVDQAIVWIVSRVVPDVFAAVNMSWVLMVVLSGLSATWCMRQLGASLVSAPVGGTLFALSPYAVYRNLDHFWMVVYLVPFACTAALRLASGTTPRRGSWKSSHVLLLAGCALLGFDYVDYAFFACFLLIVATLVGFASQPSRRTLAAGGFCVVVIAACTLTNLAPTLYSWRENGRPVVVRGRAASESEVYGLKIRQLVTPVYPHAFPPFRDWIAKDQQARFPLENENAISRLGLVGTLGFLGLLAMLFVRVPGTSRVRLATTMNASRLTLAAILLGTAGGFGSLFALLINSQIYAYNRIAPFIAFLSLAAIVLWLDELFRTPRRRIFAASLVLLIGLGDQQFAAARMNAQYAIINPEVSSLNVFVRQLEKRLLDGAMLVQLPLRPFLSDIGVARMQPHDHFKLYLVSRTLRWHYPALSNEQVKWQHAAERLDPRQLASQLASEGFSAIVVDRYGYQDNGASAIAAMRAVLTNSDEFARTDRYVAFDISRLAGAGSATRLSADSGPPTLTMHRCSGEDLLGLLDRIGDTWTPFDGKKVRLRGSDVTRVTGWAVDQQRKLPAWGVDVTIDQTPFPTFYGSNREDVSAYFKHPPYLATGFSTDIPANTIAAGPHTLYLRIVSSNGDCYVQTSGIPLVVE